MARRQLTQRQLVEFFKVYRELFAEWLVEHDTVLVRSVGPIKQYIAFEGLRDGAYRPSCSVRVRTIPSAQLLFRFLDVKHREVLPREHDAKWPRVVSAMETQFLPSVRKPLNIAEVIRLAEDEVATGRAGNIQYCAGLAVLTAYAGDIKRALAWCSRSEDQLEVLGRAPEDWEVGLVKLVRQLQDAIKQGQEKSLSFLKSIIED